MQPEPESARAERRLFANAVTTVVVLLLVYAAFDDITTDNATTFRFEYTLLTASAAWLLFIAWSLGRAGHRALGVVSGVAVAGAVWAQRAIGPKGSMAPGLRPEHIVIVAAYLWFWALVGAMLWLVWRRTRVRA